MTQSAWMRTCASGLGLGALPFLPESAAVPMISMAELPSYSIGCHVSPCGDATGCKASRASYGCRCIMVVIQQDCTSKEGVGIIATMESRVPSPMLPISRPTCMR